jgi:PAS domain S-box-containing protein
VLDAKGDIQVFNSAAEWITGYSAEEIGGKNWFEILVPRERYPAVWEEFERLVAGGIPKEFENPILTKDGQERHIVWKNSEVIHDGQVAGTVSFGIDVTDRKQSEREREELIARLEAQNAELERFTYTVSHDLKSPLITIKGYIGLLSEDLHETGTESVRSDLERISNAADKMGSLLEDLLELSRIGRLANPPESVSLGELAHDAMELLQGQLEDKHIRVDVLPNLPVVRGDRIRLREVVQNLIDNAIKYMGDQPQPRIEIGARQDGGGTTCYVRDNGIGIEPRFHAKVFGLFDQLDPNVDGTGIGLALVKRIVEVHGGRIWIESDGKGRGSTFCFTLPATAKLSECGTRS